MTMSPYLYPGDKGTLSIPHEDAFISVEGELKIAACDWCIGCLFEFNGLNLSM